MNKKDFMNELYALLSPLDENERRDIMRDFEEHFAAGREKGKSDEQICRELGSPRQCASLFMTPEQSVRIANASKVNTLIYKILAICLIVALVGVAPASLGLAAAACWIVVISCVSGVVLSSWLVFGFFVSVAVVLIAAAVLMDLIMVALIKYCWKRGGM